MFGPESFVQYMVVTQSAPFNGWKGMDPILIPKFEEGQQEAITRDVLEAEGKLTYESYSLSIGSCFEHLDLIHRHH